MYFEIPLTYGVKVMAELNSESLAARSEPSGGSDEVETAINIQTATRAKKFSKPCFLKPSGAKIFLK